MGNKRSKPPKRGPILKVSESKPLRLYVVHLIKDDYTPMEFVVEVLERFFSTGRDSAKQSCYRRDIVETKVVKVN